VPRAAGRNFHDYRCDVTYSAASGRSAGEAVNRCASYAAPSGYPSKAAFNCCRSADYIPARNDSAFGRCCTDCCWPVLIRSASKGPVRRRHGRVGKPRFQGLSFCWNAELRDDQERCVYVRKKRHGRRVSGRQE